MLKTLRKRRSQDKELQRPHSYPDTEIAKVPEDAVENPKSSTKDVYMKSDSLKSSESKQEKTSTKSVENSSKKDRPDSLKSNEKKKGKTSTKTVENTSEKNRPSSKSGSRKTRCEETLDKLSHLVATDSTDGTLVSRNKDDLPEIINEVYTMAKVEKNHKKMKTESVFDTLKQVPGSTEDEVVKTKAVMALGYLIWDRADTSIVYEAAKKTHAITQLLNQLVPLIASNDDVSSGCSQSDLLQSLKHYAVDEKNKKIICEEGGKDIIPTFLKSDKPAVQSLAAELICSLSFIESNRCLLLKEKSLLKDLTKLTHSPDNHVSRNSANALLVLQDYMHDDVFVSQGETSTDGHQHVDIDQEIDSEDDDDVIIRPGSAKRTGTTEVDLQLKSVAPVPPPPPPPPAAAPPPPPPAAPAVFSHGPLPPPPPTQRKEGHIMLSYNWDNQKLVLKINEKLKEHGYKTWIDVEHMSDSILDAMAHAVQDADIVLLCFCQSYQNSTNCRTEGEYVFSRKKPLIPLRMKSYSPQNWLGALIGNQLYVDFSDGEVVFNDKMKDLLEQIKRRQSKLADQTIPLTELDAPKSQDLVADIGAKKHSISLLASSSLSREPQEFAKWKATLKHQIPQCGWCAFNYTPESSSEGRDFPTGSSPLPPISSHSSIKDWTCSDVKEWLVQCGIERYNSMLIDQLDGQNLIQLINLRNEAPEFFYKSLQKDMGLQLLDILKFAQELQQLKLQPQTDCS